MKRIALLAFLTIAVSAAWAQAQKPAPAKEAAKPAAAAAEGAKKSRRGEDARHCLDKPSNAEIIKCAEEYL